VTAERFKPDMRRFINFRQAERNYLEAHAEGFLKMAQLFRECGVSYAEFTEAVKTYSLPVLIESWGNIFGPRYE